MHEAVFKHILVAVDGSAAAAQALALADRMAGDARVTVLTVVPDYTTADVRVGWRWSDHLELSAVGQDLFDEQHAEFPTISFILDNREVARRGYVKAVWRF